MFYKQIRKGTALLCAVLLLGTMACSAEPVETDSEEPTKAVASEEAGKVVEGQQTSGEKNNEEIGQNQVKEEQAADEVLQSPETRELIETVTNHQVTETAERTAVVKLSDSGADITGTGCEMDGNRLKIKKAGVYEISGTLSDGSIYVNVDNESEVHLILNGVTVHNETSAALFCKKAKKVTITLAEGSVNKFSDGASYVFEEGEDEPDATVYAKHDLVINGKGKLEVTSSYGDALKGKDCLYVLGGEVVVNSAEDGIVGRDLLYVADGTITVTSAADALKASNDTDVSLGNIVIDGGVFALTAENDGLQAENTLTINNGDFTIKTGGGSANATVKTEDFGFGGGGGKGFGDWGNWGQTTDTETEEDTTPSTKGLKAGTLLAVNGGRFELDTCDDALHGNIDVKVTGGEFSIAAGDDAMHAEENLLIEGAPKINITKSYEGLEGLKIVINGGEFDITASDDGINSAGGNDGSGFGRPGMGMFGGGEGEITINGGTIRISADGDGVDSNGNLTINDGVLIVCGSTRGGDGGIDFDGIFCLNGGAVFSTGGSDMAQTPDNTSGQYSLAAVITSMAQAGSKVEIMINGKTVFSEEVPKQFNYIVASSGEFAKDAEVSIRVNGEECHAGTLTDVATCFGFTGGMGGFGGNGNQGGMGGRGDKDNFGGGMPQRPNGGTTDGAWPGFSDGGSLQMPEGTWPDLFNGEFPQMPEGTWPDFSGDKGGQGSDGEIDV